MKVVKSYPGKIVFDFGTVEYCSEERGEYTREEYAESLEEYTDEQKEFIMDAIEWRFNEPFFLTGNVVWYVDYNNVRIVKTDRESLFAWLGMDDDGTDNVNGHGFIAYTEKYAIEEFKDMFTEERVNITEEV